MFDKKFITFAVLAVMVVCLWLFAQRTLLPPPPAPNPVPVANKPPEKKPEEKPTPPRDPVIEALPAQPEPAEELVPLGSIDPTSPFRLLVILTNRGAAIRSNEVANPDFTELAETPDEMFGYLGNLGLEQSPPSRCEVRVVGAGTPAAKAGLQVGDVIHSAAKGADPAVEIKAAHDFFAFLQSSTHPGDTVTLKVTRTVAGQPQELPFTIELTKRPMQVIRPQTVDFTDPWDAKPAKLKPYSYLLTLAQVGESTYPSDALPAALKGLREGTWEITRRPTEADPTVEFTRRIEAGRLTSLGSEGSLRIVKRYTLAKAPETESTNLLAPAYHLTFEIEIHNETKTAQKLAYQLDGPTGLPEEGWWYSYKVHPRHWNGAGTRDILWSSNRRPEMFITSDIAYKAKDAKDPLTPLLGASEPGKSEALDYAGVDAIYFSAIMLPEKKEAAATFDPKHEYTYSSTTAGIVGDLNADKPTRTDVTYHLTSTVREVAPGEAFKQRFTLFTGPKVPALLEPYGLGDIIVYGWFAWFARGLLFVLHLIYSVVPNYGIAIILLTVVVRLAVYPISRQVALSAQAMQELQPELEKINETHKDNLIKKQEATQALYAKHGINPAAGCMFMPLQMPIFVGLYRGLAIDVSLRGAPLIPGLSWCSNLAGPDMLWYWQPTLEPIVGAWLVGDYGHLGPYFNILPILTMILFVWQAKQFQQPAMTEEQESMQNVSTFMMVFMGFMFFKVSSGLCLYFIVSSLWGVLEKIYVTSGPKEKITKEPTVEQLADTAKDIQAKKDRKKRGSRKSDRNGDDDEEGSDSAPPADPWSAFLRILGMAAKK